MGVDIFGMNPRSLNGDFFILSYDLIYVKSNRSI